MLEFLESRLLLSRAWFVAPSGDDHGAGTLAQPFATIQKAASLAVAGDTVYMRAGIYRETVTPANSGTARAPITYLPYNNEVVTISGADPVGGWSKYNTGAIYQASQSWDLGAGNNQVFFDQNMMTEARWPNSGADPLHPTTASVVSAVMNAPSGSNLVSATATITDSSIPGGANSLAGEIIHIGAGQNWVVQTGTVLSSAPGSLTFSFEHRTRYEIPQAGNKFFLTGSFKQLDAPAEWYRDPTTGRLYLWTPTGDNPALHDIEAKRRLFAFELRGRSYIQVEGIRLFAAAIDTGPATSHVLLSGLNARYVSNQTLNALPWDRQNAGSRSGVILDGTGNTLINSTIAYSSGNGVWVGGSKNTVQNCTIHDVDYAGGDEAGITVTGAGQQIVSNTIHDTGRNGVLASIAVGGKIDSNVIYDIGLLTTDLGAIYTHGGIAGGLEIAYNKISNVRTGGYGGVGVYLDNGSSGYIVHDNAIANVDITLKVNPPSYGNHIYNDPIGFGAQVPTPSFASKTYSTLSSTLTILPSLGGYRGEAYAINDSGTIAGWCEAGPTRPAFLYADGKLSSLPTLGGTYGTANAVNAAGQMAGASINAAGLRHAFLDSGGKVTDLGALPGDTFSSAAAINTSGEVVGVSYGPGAVGHAFAYAGGKLTSLGTLGGAVSQACGINDAGTIVGSSTLAGDRNAHAFAYFAGRMHDLGTLGGSGSFAFGINASGQIVGQSQVAGNAYVHAFVDTNGAMHDLGTLAGFTNSAATAINANGDIIGYCYTANYSAVHAFLYHNGVMSDLNKFIPASSGWTLISANAINNKGQIVGAAVDANANQRAYVLSITG